MSAQPSQESVKRATELQERERDIKRKRGLHYDLMDAIQLDDPIGALRALKLGADPLELYERKWNAICMTGLWSAHQCVAALTQAGVAVDTPGAAGNQAIHFSAGRSCPLTVEALIKAGASASALNDIGATPLERAIHRESTQVARVLLEAGADPNALVECQESILAMAALNGEPELVELLLSYGADPALKVVDGMSALDVIDGSDPGCVYLKARLERDELALSAKKPSALAKKKSI